MEIKEELKQIRERLERIEKEVNKPVFEVGRWYKNGCGAMNNFQSEDKHYGIANHGYWVKDNRWFEEESNGTWSPATPGEVKEALVKEAEKRGFKDGVIFEQEYDFGVGGNPAESYKGKGKVSGRLRLFENSHSEYNLISNGEGLIFNAKTGQWATIIKEDPITIHGHEVEFKDGKAVINDTVFDREFFEAALKVNESDFGHTHINADDIKAILKRL